MLRCNLLMLLCGLFCVFWAMSCSDKDPGKVLNDGDRDAIGEEGSYLDGDDFPDGDDSSDGNIAGGDKDKDKDEDKDKDGDESDGDIEKEKDIDSELDGDIDVKGCELAVPLACGDSFNHDTTNYGRPDEWRAYSCTARAMTGRETIYSFNAASDSQVTINLKELSVDLDLFMLTDCDAFTCQVVSSTPMDIQDVETISFQAESGKEYFVVVDGYNDEEGSYLIEVECI